MWRQSTRVTWGGVFRSGEKGRGKREEGKKDEEREEERLFLVLDALSGMDKRKRSRRETKKEKEREREGGGEHRPN